MRIACAKKSREFSLSLSESRAESLKLPEHIPLPQMVRREFARRPARQIPVEISQINEDQFDRPLNGDRWVGGNT